MIEGIDEVAVTAWIKSKIPDLAEPVEYELITGGHSNLTYRCRDGLGRSYVLRRPPLGHVLESAHDMSREHKIIHALQGSTVPVPKTYGLCQDPAVNGADFYVMGFVDGTVLNDSVVGENVLASHRIALSHHVVNILCDLHEVAVDAVGLGDLGRKEAYLSRQLNRWTKQWVASKTHPIPEMEASQKILAERMPEQIGSSIV
ncbi:MAG: phosphotransferase family protein, partial [Pseudomonadales bacterium]